MSPERATPAGQGTDGRGTQTNTQASGENRTGVLDEQPPDDEAYQALVHLEEVTRWTLRALLDFLREYVVFSSVHEAIAVTLWVAHTYLVEEFETTPRLVVRSPSKQTGKTRLLECLELLTKNSTLSAGMSLAVLFRLIEQEQPTILQDEADTIFGSDADHEELRGLYNAGYRKNARVWRSTGPQHRPTPFKVFAAVAFAGIGDLPDTIMDRAVVVNMRRKTVDETVLPFRVRLVAQRASYIADSLAILAGDLRPWLHWQIPSMPPDVTDRQADIWEPLVTIADLAGDVWGQAARDAMASMSAAQAVDDADSSSPLRLLRDLREVFGDDEERVSTATLLARLYAMDESPWSEVEFGQMVLNATKMSHLLKPYGIKPTSRWSEGSGPSRVSVRGYKRSDLEDAWRRYLPR